mmetsp:Transcript_16655/g.35257  ORF Transcript_16655/g.35257 Transcript_16655/m.35257 type:complete len:648 (+) Transcript_16655:124-2067(+)
MTRKKTTAGIGQQLIADRARKQEELRRKADLDNQSFVLGQSQRSVLEQSNLDELIATVALKKEMYAEITGETELVSEGPILISTEKVVVAERAAADRRELVSIPRRPRWKEGMSAEELALLESETFMDWKRGLAQTAQEEGLTLTPYERNLEFWRQLWRCIERSDLLVQIVDARDPHFYHSLDLGRYVQELDGSKRMMLLLNKADFLSAEQRKAWTQHYAKRGVDAVFFSALREVTRQSVSKMSTSCVQGAQTRRQNPEAQNHKEEEEAREDEEVSEDKAVPGAAVVDAAAVPVPGLDSSDDDLAHDGAASEGRKGAPQASAAHQEEEGFGAREGDGDSEDEGAPMGFLADDVLDVVDAEQLLEELLARLPEASSVAETSRNGDERRGTIGFVGYPNVGKSTVINAIVGAKRVGMSSTPGKTKRIQTLELSNLGVTVCDCPGLVFPSVVATKAHLVVNNTVPLDDLQDCWSPLSLIVEKVGYENLLKKYSCGSQVKDAAKRSGDHVLDATHSFLAAFALKRNHLLRIGVPDENWAARKVLRDYVSGTLLHCEPPPSPQGSIAVARGSAESPSSALAEAKEEEVKEEVEEEEDFGDLDEYLKQCPKPGKKMTKRAVRAMNKQLLKGTPQQPAWAVSANLRIGGKVCVG